MTRIEALISKLNTTIAELQLNKMLFDLHGICTKVTGRYNLATIGGSYIWDVLANDWVLFDNKPLMYHVINYEKVEQIDNGNDLKCNYSFTTTILYQRDGTFSDSQVVEWYKKRVTAFYDKTSALNTAIGGNSDLTLIDFNYNSEQNYLSDFPNTGETYTPQVGCIKVMWEAFIDYNPCNFSSCELETYC